METEYLGDDKMCPMTLLRDDGPYPCCKMQCQWWMNDACAVNDLAWSLHLLLKQQGG